jgi:hypothetical protein
MCVFHFFSTSALITIFKSWCLVEAAESKTRVGVGRDVIMSPRFLSRKTQHFHHSRNMPRTKPTSLAREQFDK